MIEQIVQLTVLSAPFPNFWPALWKPYKTLYGRSNDSSFTRATRKLPSPMDANVEATPSVGHNPPSCWTSPRASRRLPLHRSIGAAAQPRARVLEQPCMPPTLAWSRQRRAASPPSAATRSRRARPAPRRRLMSSVAARSCAIGERERRYFGFNEGMSGEERGRENKKGRKKGKGRETREREKRKKKERKKERK
jgi:hypothetical protein